MKPRLIERWLPIAALGEESVRERRSMTALPPTYYLHVWWARRPLVASRAAVLASLLPADANRFDFLHALGIHGDPVAARRTMDAARRAGVKYDEPYGYRRAFTYSLSSKDRDWIAGELLRSGATGVVLDPTAGGGSIPFETARLGIAAVANDLNPVAALILKATVEFPTTIGSPVLEVLDEIADEFRRRLGPRIARFYPASTADRVDITYLWARTVQCPHCEGLVPLSPNWNLDSSGTGVRVRPNKETRRCEFDIVSSKRQQSEGTVAEGDARCPFLDCQRNIDGDEIKRQAQDGRMGEQIYAVALKERTIRRSKAGKAKEAWERKFRAPVKADEVDNLARSHVSEQSGEWEAMDVLPTERVPDGSKTNEALRYGFKRWSDQFSARQLIGHCEAVAVFRQLLEERQKASALDETTKAAFVYLSFTIDKLINYNCRLTRWDSTTGRVRSKFDRHDFAFVWSYAEMAVLADDLGYDWAVEQTKKCVAELINLSSPAEQSLPRKGKLATLRFEQPRAASKISVTNQSADSLAHLEDESIDAVVMDPPYYDNVMYAELSDFFYVWLKRTAGYVYPELFKRQLTDKENEAVANPSKFAGTGHAKAAAGQDYQRRMAAIFTECRRVLKADGILTLMFTHKATGAWDALTTGLMEAGFTITASWPINTEAEGSLHIRNKSAANSTIFLVCRPRPARAKDDVAYWEDVEPLVAAAVRTRIQEFEEAGIRGVDLYLSCFGPALEEFAKFWPLKRGQPKAEPTAKAKRRKSKLPGIVEDPYAVSPEDALDAARREVKKWKLDRLLRSSRHADLDALSEWFVLAWDAFRAPEFPYDEGLRLARVVGIDLDNSIVGIVAEKKGSNLLLWDSAKRAAKSKLGPTDGSRSLLDALHHAAHRVRTVGLDAARELLETTKVDKHPGFTASLAALLEVLPVSRAFSGAEDGEGAVGDAARDFDALEKLRRLAYSARIPEPQQLELFKQAVG